MEKYEIAVLKLNESAVLPTRAHKDDAGLDLYSLENVVLEPGKSYLVKTGIALAVPDRHVGLIADRSSLAKKGIKTIGGVIDAGYRGEIQVMMWNLTQQTYLIEVSQRIAQLLILPIVTPDPVEVNELDQTLRGEGGFGSTGV